MLQRLSQQDRRVGLQQPVWLGGLAIAVPPHCVDQGTARDIISAKICRTPHLSHLSTVFDNAGIATRHLARPIEWYLEDRSWSERTDAYLEAATALYCDAADRALNSAGLSPSQIDCLVTISSTGIATPTIDARVAERMGFGSHVQRLPVFGLGCAGGVAGLAIAASLARAERGKNILMVCLELCSLALRTDRRSKSDIIASALFGDGAAALCLSTDSRLGGLQVVSSAQYTWPNTLGVMGWEVDDIGLGVIFDRSIPTFVTRYLPAAAANCLQQLGLPANEVGRFVCHPGGRKVIDALEQALQLTSGSLDAEREILCRYGNMSAPTVLFVLQEVLRSSGGPGIKGPLVLSALGPGFTLATLQLDFDA